MTRYIIFVDHHMICSGFETMTFNIHRRIQRHSDIVPSDNSELHVNRTLGTGAGQRGKAVQQI
jgi:hypothetical protein